MGEGLLERVARESPEFLMLWCSLRRQWLPEAPPLAAMTDEERAAAIDEALAALAAPVPTAREDDGPT